MTNQNERRRSERAAVMLSATLEERTGHVQVRMANLSTEGAAVVGAALEPYSKVVLRRDGMDVPSRVVWVNGRCSGLRFERPAAIDTMLPQVPRRRAPHRPRSGRPGLKCVPLSEADRLVLERWGTAGTSALGD